jgi:integrase
MVRQPSNRDEKPGHREDILRVLPVDEWISRNPARLIKRQRGRDAKDRRSEQKLPFSDQELRTMYDACETKYGKQEIKWSREIHHQRVSGEYVRYNFEWTGQDLADFISVSVYTGLRISDVCMFHIDRMESSGEIQIRTTKAGTHVYTWVPDWLQERIRARAREVGPYIFASSGKFVGDRTGFSARREAEEPVKLTAGGIKVALGFFRAAAMDQRSAIVADYLAEDVDSVFSS